MTKNIQTVTMDEIWKDNSDGHIPVLMEIFNPDIKWDDGSLEQENMYLRVIDDSNPVVYQGKKYLPCKFVYTPPEENGKQLGQANITLSAIDSRVVQLLRSVEVECEINIVAAFAKRIIVQEGGVEKITYKFLPIDELKTQLSSANYNRMTAQLSLTSKNVLELNVPRDIATRDKLPSVDEDV